MNGEAVLAGPAWLKKRLGQTDLSKEISRQGSCPARSNILSPQSILAGCKKQRPPC